MTVDEVLRYVRTPNAAPLLREFFDGQMGVACVEDLVRGIDLDNPETVEKIRKVYNRVYRLWRIPVRNVTDAERAAAPWEV